MSSSYFLHNSCEVGVHPNFWRGVKNVIVHELLNPKMAKDAQNQRTYFEGKFARRTFDYAKQNSQEPRKLIVSFKLSEIDDL